MAGDRGIDNPVPSQFTQQFETISKDLWKHDDFKEHILNTIKGHVPIQQEIQNIVWTTIRAKIVWFIIGGIVFLGGIFVKSYMEEFASYAAHQQFEAKQVTQQTK